MVLAVPSTSLANSVLVLLCASASSQRSLAAYTPPTKYVIVSNAQTGTIAYSKVPLSGAFPKPTVLISEGLGHPQGIAVDQKRQLLLVADSELKQVVSYGLTIDVDGSLRVDEQTPVVDNAEARWVTVDGSGNVYVSDELGQSIMKVSQRQILDGDTRAQVLYTAEGGTGFKTAALSAPGGIATDNLHLYWSNKVNGDKAGDLVKASVLPTGNRTGSAMALSSNNTKVYGVCVAADNVFFTDDQAKVYVTKRTGGAPVTVSSSFGHPRGCAWDGDATMYVADRSLGAVYALPGPMVALTETKATKAFEYADAFGVAVFVASAWRARLLGLLPFALATVSAALSVHM